MRAGLCIPFASYGYILRGRENASAPSYYSVTLPLAAAHHREFISHYNLKDCVGTAGADDTVRFETRSRIADAAWRLTDSEFAVSNKTKASMSGHYAGEKDTLVSKVSSFFIVCKS